MECQVDKNEILSQIEFPKPHTEEKYPWGEWFDGSVWLLKYTEDYDVDTKSFRSAVYMAAKRYKKNVRTHVPRQGNCLYVQSLGNAK